RLTASVNTFNGSPLLSNRLLSLPFKKCVITSPFRNKGITSWIFGGAEPMWVIIGNFNCSLISTAFSKGIVPLPFTTLLLIRDFKPMTISLYGCAAVIHCCWYIQVKLDSSSILSRPILDMFKIEDTSVSVFTERLYHYAILSA